MCVSVSVCVWHIMRRGISANWSRGGFLCPNLDTISDFRNVLHHNNDNVGKTGNTWLTTLYSDLLSVWQSVFHMMFVSHKQFQHGRVWCQDNSYIICHCRTSIGLAKKTRVFYLGLLTSAWVLVIVSLNSVCVYETERERDRDRDRAYEYMSMKEFGVFYFSHLSMVVM